MWYTEIYPVLEHIAEPREGRIRDFSAQMEKE